MRLLARLARASSHDPSTIGFAYEFIALHDTIDRFALPMQLFDDLLNAFVQDVGTTALRDLGRTCSTTAADRRTRSAGSCSGSAAITTIASTRRRTPSARRCS